MKYLKTYENHSKGKIEKVLSDAIKNGEIDMVKINLNQLMNRFKDDNEPEIDVLKSSSPITFKYFVYSGAKFISEGDWGRMREYIEKFKKLGLNVDKVEELLPKVERYKYLQWQLDSM